MPCWLGLSWCHTAMFLPYCGTNVVVKMILNEPADNTGFSNSSVLKTKGLHIIHSSLKQTL